MKVKSIRKRIVAFALAATVIPAIGLGLVSFWRYQSLVADNVAHELRVLTHYAGSELIQWQKQRVEELRALAVSTTLVDGLTAITNPPAGAKRIGGYELGLYLRSVQTKLPSIVELTMTDAAGHVVASSAAVPAAVTLPADWRESLGAQDSIVLPPRWDATRGKAALVAIARMQKADAELSGALVGVFDFGTIVPRLQGIADSPSVDIVVLTDEGQPLVSARGAANTLSPLPAATVQRLRGEPGEPLAFAGHHQRDVIGAVQIVSSPSAMIVAERESSEVETAWRRMLWLYLLLVGGLVLLVAVVAYRLSRSILAPLSALLGGARRIARGDLDVQLPVERPDEIGELTRQFNKMAGNLQNSKAAIEAASETLQQQNRMLETLSVRDGLTGLYNRQKLDTILRDQLELFRRSHRPFAVLMLDIDNFKAINDRKGHLVGDDVLSQVAAILVHSVRAIDYAARYGGEEFVVVLVETGIDPALDIAERIRHVVETTRASGDADSISITISIGVTQVVAADQSPEELLARADRALYEAKRAGRNNVQRAA